MKRWLWLGLGLSGLVASGCGSDPEPIDVLPQVCPGTSEVSLPKPGVSPLSTDTAPDGVIITYKPKVTASALAASADIAAAVEREGGTVKRRIPNMNVVSARLSPEAISALKLHPDVLSVTPNRRVRALGLPTPPPLASWQGAYSTQGSVGEYTEGLKLIQAPQVWDANNDGVIDPGAPTGEGVKVCVIDSGWDSKHPELKAAFVMGKDFVDDDDDPSDQSVSQGVVTVGGGHGTHVSATILAQFGAGSGARVAPGEEPNGVVGVAPGASLLVARVLDTDGGGRTDDVIAAVDWCHSQGARVASLSLGAPDPSETEQLMFEKVWENGNGMLSVAASGNDGKRGIAYPAAYLPSVMAVGAVDLQGEYAPFSQFGQELSVVGPGVNVLSATVLGAASLSSVTAASAPVTSSPLTYTAQGTYTGRLVNCGLGADRAACGETATCDGFVAYVDRGDLFFEEKARNVIQAGARAVIIGNNVADDAEGTFTLGSSNSHWVPTVSVSMATGASLKKLLGQDVTVSITGLDYQRESGTSMATPHVSGVAALVFSARPDLSAAHVRAVLEKTAKDDKTTPGKDEKYGYGLVQAAKAVELARTLPQGGGPLPLP
ncbi:S8 family serine peptidase [Corallococcus exiguus]|uniref:S8 family serine peptidase n=1 Tax=Corallococcus TaxID=83461 RepID=UPI000EE6EED4|nr:MULTISPECIES: S8 family serine peptidase [Corallococcus]NNB89183.1 S8 family serine peptidase [Corallococcus exiguus]NNB95331.1 S8 family serine peptidase [Corallococcus exiguus]NNC05910.1 S8 family serine peptidase [Corallococcus exiguus]NPC48203.1 S8 family serine peptidase [Corallococcus exiguus]RKH85309.1 peptidase S8 [Corallococcus sp. AB032C]